MLRTGSEEWWQTPRGPQCRAVDGAIEVTFWVDPAGDETCSPHRRGMALYHRRDRPPSECASAIAATSPGTDAWFWRTTPSPTRRGSYRFIPSDRDDDFSPEVFSADAPVTARCYAKAGATAAAGDSRSAEPAQLAGRTRPWRVRPGDAAGPRAARLGPA